MLALAAAVLTAPGCGEDDPGPSGATTRVVATTTHVADLVRNVGGDRVSVRAMLSAGSDPHDYEPRPSDVRSVAEADVVFRSGGELDGFLQEVVDNAGGRARHVSLINSVRTIEATNGRDDEQGGEGDPANPEQGDPHWWQDPRNAVRAVEAIRSALTRADAGGRGAYARNAARYASRIRRLDAAIARCVRRVPHDKRKVVTTHDALAYFARRYGIEVVGAVIPSLSTQAQPSARDTERLVRQIRQERVEAIFPESSLNPKLERAVSREAGARVGGALYADSLGPRGSPSGTYLGAMAANSQALVSGMSGGRVSCRTRP